MSVRRTWRGCGQGACFPKGPASAPSRTATEAKGDVTMHVDQVRLGARAIDWLARPAMAFSHPGEGLDHPSLSHAERRVIRMPIGAINH